MISRPVDNPLDIQRSVDEKNYSYLIHIRASVLVKFVVRAEDDEGDLAITEDAEFIRLLHHAEFTLVERNLEIDKIKTIVK